MVDKFSQEEYFCLLDKYWRAANYVSAAQLYLMDNPLLRSPIKMEQLKPRIVGHWGTVPGQNFVWAHCSRVVKKYGLDMMVISGPGHGGNFFIANSYLEGVYSEVYPDITQDEEGLKKLCKRFSFPGGVSSHVSPEVPGSIHEGGELGYSLAHAYGAVLDNPNLIVTTIVGDGEAETGPLATSWHINKFINPATDGVVLPILHLNGYKISNPTILARMDDNELISLFTGYGYKPYIVSGSDPMKMHKKMAATMDSVIADIVRIKKSNQRAIYPMIILRTPKGWTCPKVVDGKQIEGSFRAHQVPVPIKGSFQVSLLIDWLKSYHPEELFDSKGRLKAEIRAILPTGGRRISANRHTNCGVSRPLSVPNVDNYTLAIKKPGEAKAQDTEVLSYYLRDVFKLNKSNFRLFSPDETMSNRLYGVFQAESRPFNLPIFPTDECVAPRGRIMDGYLSEHVCEGMLEGYLLTGRHGMFASYEAFIRIVGSMIAQHAKWLKMSSRLKWRVPIPSLNLLLTSHCWQQDHNGFTHQDPGLLDLLASKSPDTVALYLPPDSNTLLYTFDKCLRSINKINVVVASKHPSAQWLSKAKAKQAVVKGASVWDFACMNDSNNPDVVLASCGDTPTKECVAAVELLRTLVPNLNLRFVNVIDLLKLVDPTHNPNGFSDLEFNQLFTTNKPVIFNFHGYPNLIHQLVYKRTNQEFHVSGYSEEGTITTPFDMRVRNKIDRFHLIAKIVAFAPVSEGVKNSVIDYCNKMLKKHFSYIVATGADMPEVI